MSMTNHSTPSPPPPPLRTGPMTDDVLKVIFASDQDMYPAPLTWDRLEGWTRAAPEMALCFYLPRESDDDDDDDDDDEEEEKNGGTLPSRDDVAVGAIIALPILAPFWKDLLIGRIRETDVEAASMFPPDCDSGVVEGSRVGLHVFHVERFETPGAGAARGGPRGFGFGFADISMGAVVDAAAKKGWDVVGYSALTATPEGARCFARMGFTPTGYEELWVASPENAAGAGSGAQLVVVSSGAEAETKIPEGMTDVKGRARMMAKHLI